jgi:hypothetical protein
MIVVAMLAAYRFDSRLPRLLKRFGVLLLMTALGQYALIGNSHGCHARDAAAAAPSGAVQAAADQHDHCGDAPAGAPRSSDASTCSAMVICGALVMTAHVLQVDATTPDAADAASSALVAARTRAIAPEPPPPRT